MKRNSNEYCHFRVDAGLNGEFEWFINGLFNNYKRTYENRGNFFFPDRKYLV